jgi:hydroxyacyl-ACP dehydratase HTD2-like protein with hotdog domain
MREALPIQSITEAQYRECVALSNEYVPKVLPVGWRKAFMPPPFQDQHVFESGHGLKVIFTADNLEGDGKTWLHVSMSRRSRIPTYDDMKEVKEIFVGRDRQAVQIFPKESEHINIHPYCLHLFCAVEGDGLPHFSKGGSI